MQRLEFSALNKLRLNGYPIGQYCPIRQNRAMGWQCNVEYSVMHVCRLAAGLRMKFFRFSYCLRSIDIFSIWFMSAFSLEVGVHATKCTWLMKR